METRTVLKFDIQEVQRSNPKTANKTPASMYRTDHKVPRKHKPKKNWWDSEPIYRKKI